MFELLVIACIGTRLCEYVAVPLSYPTLQRCEGQAAVIAGMVYGKHDAPFGELDYRYVCRESAERAGLDTTPPIDRRG